MAMSNAKSNTTNYVKEVKLHNGDVWYFQCDVNGNVISAPDTAMWHVFDPNGGGKRKDEVKSMRIKHRCE